MEHEEVLLIPRWVKARRVTFKYGLGDKFIGVLKTLHMLGLDSKDEDQRQGREGGAARCGGSRPARSGPSRRHDARQDVRRHMGSRPERRQARARYICIRWRTMPNA